MIEFVAHSTGLNDSGSTTTLTISKPAGVLPGQMLIASMATSGAGTVTLPSGWTQLGTPLVEGNATFVLCYRTAGSSEPANYTWTHGTGRNVGIIGAYKGVLAGAPTASAMTHTTVDATSFDMGPVTSPDGGLLIYLPVDRRNGGGVVQSWSTSDIDDARRGEVSGSATTGSTFSMGLFDSARPVSGSQARTCSATQLWAQVAIWSVTLAPAVITPTGVDSPGGVGSVTLAPGAAPVGPAAVPSGATVGSPELVPAGIVAPDGVGSSSSVGEPLLNPDIRPQGVAGTSAVGTPDLTPISVTYTLYPPTVRQTPMAWNKLHARYSLIRGICIVKRQDGTYYTTQVPAQTELEEAAGFWQGGYIHPLTPDEALDLIDAGFGEYITRETTPV